MDASALRETPGIEAIVSYFHCTKCLAELPEGYSPREWADYEVGFTVIGIQVWCKRHDHNIIHIDFEGAQHPAYTGGAVH